jgi:hypothetical protein
MTASSSVAEYSCDADRQGMDTSIRLCSLLLLSAFITTGLLLAQARGSRGVGALPLPPTSPIAAASQRPMPYRWALATVVDLNRFSMYTTLQMPPAGYLTQGTPRPRQPTEVIWRLSIVGSPVRRVSLLKRPTVPLVWVPGTAA